MGKNNSGHNKNSENEKEERSGSTRFNAGGNDSDYDGGHPADRSSENAGSISSNSERKSRESEDKAKSKGKSFNRGGNESDFDGGHPEDSRQDK